VSTEAGGAGVPSDVYIELGKLRATVEKDKVIAEKDKVIAELTLSKVVSEKNAEISVVQKELMHVTTLGLMSRGAMNVRSLLESMIYNAYNNILVERNDSTKAARRLSMKEKIIEVAKRGKSDVYLFAVLAACLH
jgi:hypothetical protein